MNNPYNHWQWRLKSRFNLTDPDKHGRRIKNKIEKEEGFLIEQTEHKAIWLIAYEGRLIKVVLDNRGDIRTVMQLKQKERDFWKRETSDQGKKITCTKGAV